MLTIVIILAEAAIIGPTLPIRPAPIPREICTKDADEIIVCGKSHAAHYRLGTQLPDEPLLFPKAEIAVGASRLAIEGEAANVGGFTSKRAMIRLKIKF